MADHDDTDLRKWLRLGVSSCLLGNPVRFDGGHKRDRYITDLLGDYCDFVPVCPEVESGLPVPREAMRLVGDPEKPRLAGSRSGRDHTAGMRAYAARRVEELAKENLAGFIFKSGSPSSGMERVKVYGDKGIPSKRGVGLFAAAFMARFPLLPVEDDGRLNDPGLRENFIERLFTMARFHEMVATNSTLSGLVAFHADHKLLIMSHSPKEVPALGGLVAHGKERDLTELQQLYLAGLMRAMKLKATVAKNVNTLDHAAGYFKKELSRDEKSEIREIIEHYRHGHVPLIVPVTIVNHYVRKYGKDYLARQHYLHPHPMELKLRNHV